MVVLDALIQGFLMGLLFALVALGLVVFGSSGARECEVQHPARGSARGAAGTGSAGGGYPRDREAS